MTVKELKDIVKKLPNDMEVFDCTLHGRCSEQGVHEYDYVIKAAKYKKVPCDRYVSDGFGGKYKPIHNFTWKLVTPAKTEKRNGLFLNLTPYSED